MAIIDQKGYLDGVHWEFRKRFKKLAKELERETGWDIKIRSGRRSCATQNRIYAQGRSAPGSIVTYAPGCRSWHVVGRAMDADPIDPATGKAPRGCQPYLTTGTIWESLGGKWGGRFKGFGPCGDAGHFEWHPGLSMSDVCPVATDCNDALYMVDTVEPAKVWPYVAGGFAAMAAIIIWQQRRR